jgi:hypothetical protein
MLNVLPKVNAPISNKGKGIHQPKLKDFNIPIFCSALNVFKAYEEELMSKYILQRVSVADFDSVFNSLFIAEMPPEVTGAWFISNKDIFPKNTIIPIAPAASIADLAISQYSFLSQPSRFVPGTTFVITKPIETTIKDSINANEIIEKRGFSVIFLGKFEGGREHC